MVNKQRRKTLKLLSTMFGVSFLPSYSFGKMSVDDVPQWDKQFDAMVVGSGFAGSAAMISLIHNGVKDAIMIEQMPYLCGNSAVAF